MPPSAKKTATVDAYLAGLPPESAAALREMRDAVRACAPGATETIAYGIPTFRLDGTSLVHFAAFKAHVGFYPTPSAIRAFAPELAAYETSKGAIRFPLGAPLPLALVRKITAFRVKEVRGVA